MPCECHPRVTEKALPVDPLTPNEKTIAAMKAARAGKLKIVGGVEQAMNDLHAGD